MRAFASFFGTDEMSFYLTSSRFPTEQRPFTRFSDVTNEIVEARIWAGIHYRNADVRAADLGRSVEQYIHHTGSRPRTERRCVERPSGRSTFIGGAASGRLKKMPRMGPGG
jgi:hypothetical protein